MGTQENAKQIAENFASTFKKQISDITPKCIQILKEETINNEEIAKKFEKIDHVTEEILKQIINKLDDKKGPGTDGIRLKD